MSVTIYGASDDLIEVEGQVREEFSYDDDQDNLLAFSDGTVLRVHYDRDGVWRITQVEYGASEFQKEEAPTKDEDNYSDRVTLTGNLTWCLYGTGLARQQAKKESEE